MNENLKRPRIIDELLRLRSEARFTRLAMAIDIAICEADMGLADELRPLVQAYCNECQQRGADVWPRRERHRRPSWNALR